MAQQKPVKYPNLIDQITKVVEAHQAVHDAVGDHVTAHHAKLEEKRKRIHVAEMAKKLIEGDKKP